MVLAKNYVVTAEDSGTMANEAQMWDHIKKQMDPLWHAERITERFTAGVPDVCYVLPGDVMGWLELKVVPEKYNLVTGLIPWKSPAQPLFLTRWARAGGNAGVLLRVGPSVWLYWRADGTLDWNRKIQGPISKAPRPVRADKGYGQLAPYFVDVLLRKGL